MGAPRPRHITSLPRCGDPPGSKCEVKDMTHGAAGPTAFSRARENAYERRGPFPRGSFLNTTDTTARQAPTGHTWLHKNHTLRDTVSGIKVRDPQKGLREGGESSPTFTNARVKGSITSPSQPKDSSHTPSAGVGGWPNGTVGFETRPMKKMSLPHTQKWPQGGARSLIEKNLLQARGPTTPRGRSQGHTLRPQFPKPRAGENLGTRNGRRRESGVG